MTSLRGDRIQARKKVWRMRCLAPSAGYVGACLRRGAPVVEADGPHQEGEHRTRVGTLRPCRGLRGDHVEENSGSGSARRDGNGKECARRLAPATASTSKQRRREAKVEERGQRRAFPRSENCRHTHASTLRPCRWLCGDTVQEKPRWNGGVARRSEGVVWKLVLATRARLHGGSHPSLGERMTSAASHIGDDLPGPFDACLGRSCRQRRARRRGGSMPGPRGRVPGSYGNPATVPMAARGPCGGEVGAEWRCDGDAK